jgi:hypothetical protein
MMLVLTPDDLQRLSPASREEILALLHSRIVQASGSEPPADYWEGEEGYYPPETPTIDDVLEEKHVVDVTAEQARELVANISAKSQQTLKLFAPGAPVALDDLIGNGRPYRDFTDLKRSFVGAVNRRLRTVLGDRLAVLFVSDRDKTRIRITPTAAASLCEVLEVPATG